MEQNKHLIALHTERPSSSQAVRALYDTAQWWPDRTLSRIAQALNQDLAVGVWVDERLIGFARAVTDTVFRAYIEDVIIHPAYRRNGIATHMLEYLLTHLAHIETISLFGSTDLIRLYEHLQFRVRRSQIVLHRSPPH